MFLIALGALALSSLFLVFGGGEMILGLLGMLLFRK